MSKIYSVEVILEASHDLFNIALLLEKGASLGFVYHDHVDGKMYNLSMLCEVSSTETPRSFFCCKIKERIS
mgnify:CR=1 FL=1